MASSVVSSPLTSDLSEETPPGRLRKSSGSPSDGRKLAGGMPSDGRKSSVTPSDVKKAAMTEEEKKKNKQALADKYFKLMEKYGPKRHSLFQNSKNRSGSGQEKPAVKPVGFVIKFRLSHAYKALEKQEIEAFHPTIKPVRKRKHTKFLLPDDPPGVDVRDGVGVYAGTESVGTGTGTVTGLARTGTTGRRVQIRITGVGGAKEKENTRSGGGGVWRTLTQQKASVAVQLKEKQQREQVLKAAKGSKVGPEQQQQSNKKGESQKQSSHQKGTHTAYGGANPKQTQSCQGGRLGDAKINDGTLSERKLAIERSLVQVKTGGMGKPGSVAAKTEGSYGDSAFRMFSDSGFSSSITMDAVTVRTKSAFGDGSRPSSSRSRCVATSTPKPHQTSSIPVPADSPNRPISGKKSAPVANSRSTAPRRPKSAAPSREKSGNEKTRCLSDILRVDRKQGGESRKEGDGSQKMMAPRKVSKYLYHMCNCHQVARKETLAKLFKMKKVSGVIDVFGCPETQDPRANNLRCPFCQVVPQKRINAWLENVQVE